MDAGLVNEQQLRVALSEQRKHGGRLGHTLVQLGFVDDQAMVSALSRQLNLPVVDLDSAELTPSLAQYLRYEMAERYAVCPLSADARKRVIQVATSDPTNLDVVQALTFQTGMKVELVVSSAGAIERAHRRVYGRGARPPAPNPAVVQDKLEALAARVTALEGQLEEQRQTIARLREALDRAVAPPTAGSEEDASTTSTASPA